MDIEIREGVSTCNVLAPCVATLLGGAAGHLLDGVVGGDEARDVGGWSSSSLMSTRLKTDSSPIASGAKLPFFF